VLLVKLRAEERLLTREFPAQYEQYRREVPQLVPGLHRLPGRR
jgi:protein-S-isoprenylcysteine O-methyltransferase Ste14